MSAGVPHSKVEEIGELIGHLILLLEPENKGKTAKLLSKFKTHEDRTSVLGKLQDKYDALIKARIREIVKEKKKGRSEMSAFTEQSIQYKGQEARLLGALFDEYPDTKPDGLKKYDGVTSASVSSSSSSVAATSRSLSTATTTNKTSDLMVNELGKDATRTVVKSGLWEKKRAVIASAPKSALGARNPNTSHAAVELPTASSPTSITLQDDYAVSSRSGSSVTHARSGSMKHLRPRSSSATVDAPLPKGDEKDAESRRLARQVEILQRLLHQQTLEVESQRRRADEAAEERDVLKVKTDELLSQQQQKKSAAQNQQRSPSAWPSRSSSTISPPPMSEIPSEYEKPIPSYFIRNLNNSVGGNPFGKTESDRVGSAGLPLSAPPALNRVFRMSTNNSDPMHKNRQERGRSTSPKMKGGNGLRFSPSGGHDHGRSFSPRGESDLHHRHTSNPLAALKRTVSTSKPAGKKIGAAFTLEGGSVQRSPQRHQHVQQNTNTHIHMLKNNTTPATNAFFAAYGVPAGSHSAHFGGLDPSKGEPSIFGPRHREAPGAQMPQFHHHQQYTHGRKRLVL